MDYESRETLAKAYEFLKLQQEIIHANTNAIEALVNTLVTIDPKTHAKYAAEMKAMGDSPQSEQAKQHAQVIGVIDSVIATLRSGQIGQA